jgi:hypothetical protein
LSASGHHCAILDAHKFLNLAHVCEDAILENSPDVAKLGNIISVSSICQALVSEIGQGQGFARKLL